MCTQFFFNLIPTCSVVAVWQVEGTVPLSDLLAKNHAKRLPQSRGGLEEAVCGSCVLSLLNTLLVLHEMRQVRPSACGEPLMLARPSADPCSVAELVPLALLIPSFCRQPHHEISPASVVLCDGIFKLRPFSPLPDMTDGWPTASSPGDTTSHAVSVVARQWYQSPEVRETLEPSLNHAA